MAQFYFFFSWLIQLYVNTLLKSNTIQVANPFAFFVKAYFSAEELSLGIETNKMYMIKFL